MCKFGFDFSTDLPLLTTKFAPSYDTTSVSSIFTPCSVGKRKQSTIYWVWINRGRDHGGGDESPPRFCQGGRNAFRPLLDFGK